jgi:hypothetical protein
VEMTLKAAVLATITAIGLAGPADAQPLAWYGFSRDGNSCETVQYTAWRLAANSGVSTPYELADYFRRSGIEFRIETSDRSQYGPGPVVTLIWKNRSRDISWIFFSSLKTCRAAVAVAIANGELPNPDDFR